MSRKVIGITCSTLPATQESGSRQALNSAYVRAVEQAGGVPVVLPNVQERASVGAVLGAIDGLLLSGGADVAPAYYGEEPHPALGTVDDARDALELPLIREAVRQDMPLLAICRGIQVLNIALGGTLFQDLPAQHPTALEHQQSKIGIARDGFSHNVMVGAGSRLRTILGADEVPTNSFHHQALRDVAGELVVSARATDGIIEAVERPASRYLIGVQFHPEETVARDENSRKVFRSFVEAV